MKFLSACVLVSVFFLSVLFAQANAAEGKAFIKSIDHKSLPLAFEDASDEALPHAEFLKALELIETSNYTVLSEGHVRDLFITLSYDSRARNREAGGNCAVRRSYIQNYLRNQRIKSGKLLINCPRNDGQMRLIDQVTGNRFTFTNFHDVNLVAVPNGLSVLDVQFKSEPVSLSSYLAHVEASQKLRPYANRSRSDRGYCYWSID